MSMGYSKMIFTDYTSTIGLIFKIHEACKKMDIEKTNNPTKKLSKDVIENS